jgi:uncharacterized cupredoxin-like copper-binding protein
MRSIINCLKKVSLWLSIAIAIWIALPDFALAALPDRATPMTVQVSLGNTANELKFEPNNLQLKAYTTYKLLLSNPSPQKHYFTALEFANRSWTQKVDAGNVEIKGAIQELELRSTTNAQWWLVPMKPGTYRLRCTVPGHTEAGMIGTITVN